MSTSPTTLPILSCLPSILLLFSSILFLYLLVHLLSIIYYISILLSSLLLSCGLLIHLSLHSLSLCIILFPNAVFSSLLHLSFLPFPISFLILLYSSTLPCSTSPPLTTSIPFPLIYINILILFVIIFSLYIDSSSVIVLFLSSFLHNLLQIHYLPFILTNHRSHIPINLSLEYSFSKYLLPSCLLFLLIYSFLLIFK